MTPKSDDPDLSPETAAGGEIWDTRAELLLASAVKRHGTANWDLVAMEMQSRCASAARFTPSECRLHSRHLHRRFAAGDENGGGGLGDDEDPAAAAAAEWMEKLRKLRVAELRREVARRDLSIGSLQSKVKRLEEERERSISGAGTPAVKQEEAEDEETVVPKGSPEDDDLAGVDRVSGGESGRSCKESNSSDLKRPGHDAGIASTTGDGDEADMEKEEAAAGELVSVKREEASGESVAGSKEADEEKESSDVQSSASPSRHREREGGGGEETGTKAEEASPSSSAPQAIPAAEAEALSTFLESVRTSKAGSVFERRLEGQDDANYRSTIRRHVDLEMIRSKLEGGGTNYSSASEFHRDLLLLCTNALVFFPRGSPEHAAAVQMRALVTKNMSASVRKDQPGSSGKASSAPSAASKKPKADADVGSLLEKTAPIIVCRKRSSVTKAAAAAAKAEKVEKEEAEEEEENDVKKKVATKDKTRGLRTNKSRGGLARKAAANQRAGKDSESESAAAEGTKKSDTKGGRGAASGGVAKKRNAVDFLNRMKQNSGPSTERVSLLETLKLSAAAEQKSGKGEAQKESGSSSKRGKDSPAGRRIGRPPKRAAAPPSPPPSKRARGSGKRGGKK